MKWSVQRGGSKIDATFYRKLGEGGGLGGMIQSGDYLQFSQGRINPRLGVLYGYTPSFQPTNTQKYIGSLLAQSSYV